STGISRALRLVSVAADTAMLIPAAMASSSQKQAATARVRGSGSLSERKCRLMFVPPCPACHLDSRRHRCPSVRPVPAYQKNTEAGGNGDNKPTFADEIKAFPGG